MRVRIEATARDDLVEDYRFYEARQADWVIIFGVSLLRHRVSEDFWWDPSQGIPVFASCVVPEISFCNLLRRGEGWCGCVGGSGLSERALVDSEKVAVEMKLQGVGDKEQGTRSKEQVARSERRGKWQMAEERLTRRREGTKVR